MNITNINQTACLFIWTTMNGSSKDHKAWEKMKLNNVSIHIYWIWYVLYYSDLIGTYNKDFKLMD